METTCCQGSERFTHCLISTLSRGIKDKVAWSPHTTSFSLFSAASKTRWHETHTLPCFFSFPLCQPCLSSLTPQQHRDLTQLSSIRYPSLSFSYFTLIYGFSPVFYIPLLVFRITISSLMADSCSTKYIIVLPYHKCIQAENSKNR